MPVFISYSHADKEFVDKLAAHLVKNNANVWVDTWELNVGDSILNRVQDAIQDSSALQSFCQRHQHSLSGARENCPLGSCAS